MQYPHRLQVLHRLSILGLAILIFVVLRGGLEEQLTRAETGAIAPAPDFQKLQNILTQHNFQVHLKIPPRAGAYGLIQPKTKTIWIHPLTFRLGIARQTLIHEAVHAAQTCYSQGPLLPIGLDVPISKQARPHFLRYHQFRRHVEAEALTVQGLPNGVDYAIELLNEHC